MKPKIGSTGNLLPDPKPKAPRKISQQLLDEPAPTTDRVPDSNEHIHAQDRITGGLLFLLYFFLILAMSLSLVFSSFAQPPLRQLKIGDSIPPALWSQPLKVVNHPRGKNTITLGDYRGKLIILDFWATWCGSCIAAMPHMMEMQSRFGNKIGVVFITKESPDKAVVFSEKHRWKFLCAAGDTLLHKAFPHSFIPHYVIIDKEGKVSAITSSGELTTANLEKLIGGIPVSLAVKADRDLTSPLLTLPGLPYRQVKHYSVLLKGRIDGLPFGYTDRKVDSSLYGRCFTNNSLLELFRRAAIRAYPQLNSKEIRFDPADSASLTWPQNTRLRKDWYKDHLFSYEILLPPADTARMYQYMLRDLNGHSGFTGSLRKQKDVAGRETTVFVITRKTGL